MTAPSVPNPQSLDEAREILAGVRELIERFVEILAERDDRIETLQAQVDELVAKAGLIFATSSKPPSSDSAAQRATKPDKNKARRRGKGSGKRQGAQPGHDKHGRSGVASEELHAAHDYLPNAVCGCDGEVVIGAEPAVPGDCTGPASSTSAVGPDDARRGVPPRTAPRGRTSRGPGT